MTEIIYMENPRNIQQITRWLVNFHGTRNLVAIDAELSNQIMNSLLDEGLVTPDDARKILTAYSKIFHLRK